MIIGNVKLENNIFLAPMAGIADSTFRTICKEMGAGLVFSEMVSAKGLYYNDDNTRELTKIGEQERPVGLQIFGSEAKVMSKIVEDNLNKREDIDFIDINMGCPAPKIIKNGDGSALMKEPNKVRSILREVIKVSEKPITLKIRMGWDEDNVNGIEIAKIAEEEGVSLLTVHGRTRSMFYSGKADWDYIKQVKENISIPVVGNGDVFEPKDAIDLLEHTGCDAIAVGRGAMGNPWIFKRILNLQQGIEIPPPSYEEVINMAIYHLNLISIEKGENTGVKEMRKHIAWYIKGFKGSNVIRNTINKINNKNEIEKILLDYLEELME